MDLYLIRHADAVDAMPPSRPDEYRYLTPTGREASRQVGEELACVSLDLILTSPLVRAVQTAEIVAHAQGGDCMIELFDELSGVHPAGAIVRRLRDFAHAERLALVGHAPIMGEVIGILLDRSSIPLKKTAVCHLKVNNDSRGTFGWLKIPGRARITDTKGL